MVLDARLDSAVAPGGNSPVEFELEIWNGLVGEEVFGDARLLLCFEALVLDGPGVRRRRSLARVHPVVHGLAIEEHDPAVLRLRCGAEQEQCCNGPHETCTHPFFFTLSNTFSSMI